MNRLEPWQAERIVESIRPSLAYLVRLRRRRDKRGFTSTSQAYRLVVQDQDAMQDLMVELHYQSCGSGVGRRPGRND